MQPIITFTDLGKISYNDAWRLQESLQQKLINRKKQKQQKSREDQPRSASSENEVSRSAGHLFFLEHPHVYTIGKSGRWENLLFSDDVLKQRGIEVVKTDRGGDITYHGPGQLVGYPILDLEQFGLGIAAYIERLEEVIIQAAASFGILADRIPGRTGVWVDNNKLCAMGIKCSRYVCMHGFALNLRTDLDYYHGIIPCGIADGGVTSFEKLLGGAPERSAVTDTLLSEFQKQFRCRIVPLATSEVLQENS